MKLNVQTLLRWCSSRLLVNFYSFIFFCSVPCFGALCKNISQGVKNDCERPPLLDCVQRKTTRQLIFLAIIFPPSNKADVFVTSMK